MFKPGKLLAVLIIVVIIAAAYTVYGKDTVTVAVQGFGDVTGEMSIHFTDGTSMTITKVKAGSTFVKYDGKSVSKLSFDCMVNPKAEYGDEVRLLCDSKADAQMSKVIVKAGASMMTVIATYPLSLTEQGNYKTVDTGENSYVWKDIETTRQEMVGAPYGIGNFKVVWEVHLWFNTDDESAEVTGARVDFILPFKVTSIALPVQDQDDIPDPKDDPYKLPDYSPFKKGTFSILTAVTNVQKLGTTTLSPSIASWTTTRSFSGSSSGFGGG